MELQPKNYLDQLSAHDRKLWRKWQIAWWVGSIGALAVIIGLGLLFPDSSSTQVAENSSTNLHAPSVHASK